MVRIKSVRTINFHTFTSWYVIVYEPPPPLSVVSFFFVTFAQFSVSECTMYR